MKSMLSAVMVVLGLCCATSAFATANVAMVSVDGKTWMVQASEFDSISGIDLTITYDPSVLGSPTVKEGSFIADSLMTSNTNNPGVVRIAVVTTRPLSGGGPVVQVSFQRKAAGPPKLRLAAKIVNKDLAPMPVIPSNPPDQEAGPSDTTSDGNTTQEGGGQPSQAQKAAQPGVQSPSGSSSIVYGGSVTMPSDTTSAPEEKRSQQSTPEYREEQHREAPSVTREKAAPEKQESEAKPAGVKIEPPVSILDRFKAYSGEKTINGLLDLFVVDEGTQVRQDPPILLADGKADLKLTVPNPQGKEAPNFALKKAKLVNLQVSADGSWVVVAKPEKGAYDASVTMLVNDTAVEMPLTVAPKVDIDLDKSGKVDMSDFRLFLKDRGTEKAPKFDLNKDGRRDYMDDYIFTANFLVLNPQAREASGTGKVTDKSPAPAAKPKAR